MIALARLPSLPCRMHGTAHGFQQRHHSAGPSTHVTGIRFHSAALHMLRFRWLQKVAAQCSSMAVSNVFTRFASILAQEAIVLGLLAFFMALVVLSFFGSVLLNIVDAVFVCYALDRDTQTVTQPEVHEVFSQVSFKP